MAVALRCPACDGELLIRSRHRGRTVPCPRRGCGGRLDVPRDLETRTRVQRVVEDRRRADWMTVFALASCVLWVPVVPAAVWFLASRRIAAARDVDRKVPLELFTARTVAVTAFVCQGLWYVARYADLWFGVGGGTYWS